MRRSFTEVLRQESPFSLAREALWRTRKGWHRNRLLSRLNEEPCPVKFRKLGYYASGAPDIEATSRALITAYADEICEGRFPFLGYGTQQLGHEPKWNYDFVSGLEWPQTPLKDHDGIRFDGSDIKVPYELSRLQFLPILGKAHILTGGQRYRESAKRLLAHWIEKNPVGTGVNWSIAMEAGLRAMSICLMLDLMWPLWPDEADWLSSVTRCLWQHMLYIEAHIEFSHLVSSNHYLSNVVGLFCLAEFLDGSKMAAKRKLYRQLVEAELLRQVYADGGDYEASTGYHALVTQMFTSVLLLMRATATVPDPRFLERLRRMYGMMDQLASASGQIPQVGDCDDGRVELLLDDLQQMLVLPVVERTSLRLSNLLGIGKCLFGGRRGSTEDARWYGLTESRTESSSRVATTQSSGQKVAVFPDFGTTIASAEDVDVLFFAIPNGIRGKGSHTHNDKLSFVLRLDGEEVLCDSGTATYTRDPKLRNRFRATSAHNTIVVDGQEQNTIDSGPTGLFWIGNEAEVSPIEHWREDGQVVLRASHSGYKRLGVTHTRTIRLPQRECRAVVEDQLGGCGVHRFEINLQLAPNWKVSSIDNVDSEIRVRASGSREVEIVFSGTHDAYGQEEESSISMCYGTQTPSKRLRFWGESTLPALLTTTFGWTATASRTSDRPLRWEATNDATKQC